MTYVIRDGWVIFEDGTRVRAISGGQTVDVPAADTGTADFFLTVGADQPGPVAIAPETDIPGQIGGGVPYGDPAAPGNVSLADIIRGGSTVTSGGSQVVGSSSSLSDMVRSGTGAPFDPSNYNPNVPAGDQAGSVNVMDVVKTVAGIGAGIASIFSGRYGTANPAAYRSVSNGTPTLAERLFGLNPGRSGTVPNRSLAGVLVVVLAAIGVMILFRSRAA